MDDSEKEKYQIEEKESATYFTADFDVTPEIKKIFRDGGLFLKTLSRGRVQVTGKTVKDRAALIKSVIDKCKEPEVMEVPEVENDEEEEDESLKKLIAFKEQQKKILDTKPPEPIPPPLPKKKRNPPRRNEYQDDYGYMEEYPEDYQDYYPEDYQDYFYEDYPEDYQPELLPAEPKIIDIKQDFHYGDSLCPDRKPDDKSNKTADPAKKDRFTYTNPALKRKYTTRTRQILCWMDDSVTMELNDSQLEERHQDVLKYIEEPLKWETLKQAPLVYQFPKRMAPFFIEAFASNLPENEVHHYHIDTAATLLFSIPYDVPFQIKYDDECCWLYIFDFPEVSADEIKLQVESILDTFAKRPVLKATLSGIDGDIPFNYKELDAVAKTASSVVVATESRNSEKKVSDVEIFVMMAQWTPEKERATVAELERLYRRYALNICKQCYRIYSSLHRSKCLRLFHVGKQVPFENGALAETDRDQETGEEIIFHKYTCCGICEEQTGCKQEVMARHVFDRTLSQIEITENHMFRDACLRTILERIF